MESIQKAYVAIEEGQLHLRQRLGDGNAQQIGRQGSLPLILLHASPASSASMLPLMEALAALGGGAGGRDLYAFDNPCNGQSCAPTKSRPQMEDFAGMLDRACDVLGLGQVALHGNHTGAHIAIAWALARPDRVKLLSLDGVALLTQDQRADMLAHYAHPREPDEFGSQFSWAWQYLRDQMIFFPHYQKRAENIRQGGNFEPQLLHDLTLDILNNLGSYHLPYRAVFRHEVRADLARLKQSTLLMSASGEVGGEGGDNSDQGVLDPSFEELCQIVKSAKRVNNCASPMAKAAAIEAFLAEDHS